MRSLGEKGDKVAPPRKVKTRPGREVLPGLRQGEVVRLGQEYSVVVDKITIEQRRDVVPYGFSDGSASLDVVGPVLTTVQIDGRLTRSTLGKKRKKAQR